MQFTSIQFILFFALLLVALKICKKEHYRQIILLVSSYIFYAYWDYRFLLLLTIQTVVAYFTGICQKNKKSKSITALGIIAILAVLGFFKYYNFFVETFCSLFGLEQSLSLSILLPVGISFYSFQAISYIVDVYREKVKVESSYWKIALYIGFFPQLMSGPTVKAHDFLPQLEDEHPIHSKQLVQAGQIFLLGIAKKFVIADRLGVCVDSVYNAPAAYSWISILIAVIAYSFQIYCDFSGYSDMAIGIGKALGYDLGRNFNCPYIASNPSEFWKRWHISLSSWFKEYVYFPLGGSRKGFVRTLANLMIVMLLSGLWHGAAWTFVAWGALHGLGSVVLKVYNKIRRNNKSQKENSVIHVICIVVNFIFVSLCWVFFRSSSFENAFAIFKGLFTFQNGIQYVYVYAIIYIGLCIIANLYVAIHEKGEAKYHDLNFSKFRSWLILWSVLILTLIFSYAGDTVFIYSQF